jgi:outer membrane protein
MLALCVLVVQAEVITLENAVAAARQHQPTLRQARAQTEVIRARADQARSSLLPQVTLTGGYRRTTNNFSPQAGLVPGMATAGSIFSTDNFDSWDFGLNVTQQIYDSQQTIDRYRAARVNADAQAASELFAALTVDVNVRVAYFQARARKALVQVARETLANQERHLAQIEGFVRVGSRPEIDLAQARTDRANARLALVRAENDYAAARASLDLAMGTEASTDFDVADETLPPIDVEDQKIDTLTAEARSNRPDVAAIERSVAAQELTISSVKGAYGPTINATTSLTGRGLNDRAGLNLSAGLSLNWGLFNGLSTYSAVKEQRAQLAVLAAQRDLLRQQVRLEVEQARLAVRAAKGSIEAANEAHVNARERLRLAEGRYTAGVGNAIELGDAQLALTNAAAQKVGAEYDLAQARAQLLRSLGRRSR